MPNRMFIPISRMAHRTWSMGLVAVALVLAVAWSLLPMAPVRAEAAVSDSYNPMAPARLADTRSSGGPLAQDGTLRVRAAGTAGVPADASAVVLNVTATGAAGYGFVTVHPCGTDRPTASNLNYTAGQTIANAVIAKIGTNGEVCLYTSQAANLIVDINGWHPDTTPPGAVTNLRATGNSTNSISLAWTIPSDADFAQVLVRRSLGATPPASPTSGSLVSLRAPSATSVDDGGLAENTLYSYAVFTRDQAGNTSRPSTITYRTADATAPGRVTGLRITGATDASIALTWTNPTDPDLAEIVVRRSVGSTAPWSPTAGTQVPLAGPAPTAVLDTGLAENTPYSYAVFTRDPSGNTSPATTTTARTADITAPGRVSNLRVTASTSGSIALAWTNPTDADLSQVVVRRAQGTVPPSSPSDGTSVGLTTPKASAGTDSGLPSGTRYSYAVFAQDLLGNTSAAGTVTGATAPAAPTLLRTVYRTADTISLAWANPTDGSLAQVIVRRSLGSIPPSSPTSGERVPLSAPTASSVTDFGLAQDVTYSYSVFASDAAGNTSSAATVSARTLDVTAPGRVSNLRQAGTTSSAISLTWTNPADSDLSQIVVRRNQGSIPPTSPNEGSAVTLTAPKATTLSDTGLPSGTTYSYAVFARDLSGNTSGAATITTSTAPASIIDLRVTGRSGDSISLAWTNPTDPSLQQVIVRRATGTAPPASPTSGSAVSLDDPMATSVTDGGLAEDTAYAYSVFARDAAGNTSAAATLTGRTADITAPGKATELTVTGTTDNSISLSWANPTDADLARIIVRRAEGGTAPTGPTEGADVQLPQGVARSVTDGGLPSGTQFSYAVFTRDTAGNIAAATTITASTAPGRVTAIEVTGSTASSISLAWVNPADASLAQVIVRRAAGTVPPTSPTAGAAVTLPGPTAAAVTDTGLVENTPYSYAVFTRDAPGNTSGATSLSARTSDITAPNTVTGLQVQSRTTGSITLSWTNPTDSDLGEVIVRRALGRIPPASVTDGSAVRLAAPTATTVADSGLSSASQYTYSVFTRDTNGNLNSTARSITASTSRVYAEIAAGYDHSCALDTNGKAWCWGANYYGQLGDWTVGQGGTYTPTAVHGDRTYTSIVAGDYFTCALDGAGRAWCWGRNNYGQLGNGGQSASTPVAVSGNRVFTQLSAGGYGVCALDADGLAWCWGDNAKGRIGDGTTQSRYVPTAVSGSRAYTAIATASYHTCALDADGLAWCWGDNSSGAVGDWTSANRFTPTAVYGGRTFKDISAGGGTSCALDTSGQSWCWGYNTAGQLGDGTKTNKYYPVAVLAGRGFTQISGGLGGNTCGQESDGRAWCWGTNTSGQLGDGTTTDRTTPTAVSGSKAYSRMSIGRNHTLALDKNGQLWSWGSNTRGQYGDGTSATRLTPTAAG